MKLAQKDILDAKNEAMPDDGGYTKANFIIVDYSIVNTDRSDEDVEADTDADTEVFAENE